MKVKTYTFKWNYKFRLTLGSSPEKNDWELGFSHVVALLKTYNRVGKRSYGCT